MVNHYKVHSIRALRGQFWIEVYQIDQRCISPPRVVCVHRVSSTCHCTHRRWELMAIKGKIKLLIYNSLTIKILNNDNFVNLCFFKGTTKAFIAIS